MLDWKKKFALNLEAVREKHPLVHNITNFVVMNSSANILLAQGAFPVMAHAINEVEDMVALANCLVLNIGTLTDEWVDAMIAAGKKANSLGIPVVLDPVGAGATPLRSRKTMEILDSVQIAVIRGNASEINALVDSEGKTRGVDAIHGVDDIIEGAKSLATRRNAIVAVSGKRDLITDGKRIVRVGNGVAMMGAVTGTGCGLSATVGAFIGANEDQFGATVAAFAFYGRAGEVAGGNSTGPGSFEVAFKDALHSLSSANTDGLDITEL